MRLVLILILSLVCFGFSENQPYFLKGPIPEKAQTPYNKRVLLYSVLQNQKLTADEILQLINFEDSSETFITNYEKMQIYFLMGKYELAIDFWISNYASDKSKEKNIPLTSNPLTEFLDKVIDLNNCKKVQEQIDSIKAQNVPEDHKKLIEILATTPPFKNRYGYRLRSKDIQSITTIENPSIAGYQEFQKKLDTFERDYPNSKYIKLIPQFKQIIQQDFEERHYYLDPASFKVYTGGIGFEVFFALDISFHFAFPIQYKRTIVTPTIAKGFYTTLGYDLFDSRYFKLQPFLGAGGIHKKMAWLAGTQVDWRIYLEKGVDSKFSSQGYLALKLKYMAEWYKSSSKNSFMFGLGLHLW